MLILTRRVGESVMIGDDITLTVVEVRGDAIRLGIDAPRNVDVHREEVYRELKAANQRAASPSDDAVAALKALVDPADAAAAEPDAGAATA